MSFPTAFSLMSSSGLTRRSIQLFYKRLSTEFASQTSQVKPDNDNFCKIVGSMTGNDSLLYVILVLRHENLRKVLQEVVESSRIMTTSARLPGLCPAMTRRFVILLLFSNHKPPVKRVVCT